MAILDHKTHSFLRDERGGAALELALISPIMIIITFAVVQFLLLANATIVIKSAAYAAARSALVNDCPPNSIASLADPTVNILETCDDAAAKWETAAQLALIPISASNSNSSVRQKGNCGYPDDLINFALNRAVTDNVNMRTALENKACYAFEPENVTVNIEWLGVLAAGKPSVRATVTFRIPILVPVRNIFKTGGRPDGTFYWEGENMVELL